MDIIEALEILARNAHYSKPNIETMNSLPCAARVAISTNNSNYFKRILSNEQNYAHESRVALIDISE
jgi:hypothetical protein